MTTKQTKGARKLLPPVWGKDSFAGGVAACAALGFSTFAGAAVTPYVGVQFQETQNGGSTALTPTQTAGVVPQSNFNVVNVGAGNSATTGVLNDASGAATPVTLTYTSADAWTSGTNTSTNDGILLSGEDKSPKGAGGTANYTLNNVPAGVYNLFVYTVNDVPDNASVVQGGTTYYITDQTGSQWNTSGYVRGQSTTNGSPTVASYVEFDGITVGAGGGSILFQDVAASSTASVNGFQLVNAPEPSALGFLGIGAVTLLARRRRRNGSSDA